MPRSLLIRRTLVSLGLIALLLTVSSLVRAQLASMREPPAKAPEVDLRIAVRVQTAKRQTFSETLSGYGRARAMRRTEVSAELAGLVVRIAPELEAGNQVGAGEPLVWLDDRDRKNGVASNEARLVRNEAEKSRLIADRAQIDRQLAIAQEELTVAQRELQRVERLVERGVATTSARDAELLRVTLRRAAVARLDGDREKNVAQMKSNEADRADAEVALRQARTELERSIVRAPYAGRIESRMVQKGARVAPGAPLFELVDLERIEIPVSLPASRYGEVTPGAAAEVRLPGGGDHKWTIPVKRIAPTVRADDRTFLVYLESRGPNAVPPGAFVSARIAGRRFERVFAIPRTAFVKDRIYVAENGIARTRRPRVVKSLPATVLCDEGLEEGERIVVTNLEEVADGARIAATESADPSGDA